MRLRRAVSFCLSGGIAVSAAAQQPVQEKVRVTVVEVTVHASRGSGEAVTGLTPRDLRLFVDGRDVPIESLEWVSNAAKPPAAALPAAPAAPPEEKETAAGAPVPSGRLVVLFFQWHIEASKIEGHLRMTRQALEFVDTLRPEDRAAVVTFGSRLWLRQDFTSDRALLKKAVADALALETGPLAGGPPSLGSVARSGASATSIEKAFLALADALRPLPGSKAIVFFGWGVGRYDFLTPDRALGTMSYSADFQRAVTLLGEAQAPVFALDVSGGHHSLEVGLERLSYETGGYYLPTWDFPTGAMKNVAQAIAGHYVLVFRPPALPSGTHEIRLDGPSGVRLRYRQLYED
jgi:VWFA-related protein